MASSMESNYSSVPQRGHFVEMVEIGVSHWPAAITTLLLLLVAYSLQGYLKGDPNANLPQVGDEDLNTRWTAFLGPGSWEMYKEGYRKVS